MGKEPKRIFTVDEMVEVKAGTAPIIKLDPDTMVVVGNTAMLFDEGGAYIILPIDTWKNTVAKAVAKQETREPTEEEIADFLAASKMTRQVKRAIQRDRMN